MAKPMPNKPKPKSKPKLPHILSQSSLSNSSLRSGFFPTAYQANSTYSSTPSQTSSVWNWENYYPPSPPDSEFFDQRNTNTNTHFFNEQQRHHFDGDEEEEEEESEEKATEYDFFEKRENRKYRREEDETEVETEVATEAEREREEVQCSEWEDHYSSTSSSEEEEEEEVGGQDGDLRSEIGTRSNFGGSMAPPPVANSEDAGSSAGSYRTREIWSDNMKMVVRHKDLNEIVTAIKEYFDKAAAAGDKVSEMLDIGRAQLDRSFRQLKSEKEFPYCVFLNLFCFEGFVWLLIKCRTMLELLGE